MKIQTRWVVLAFLFSPLPEGHAEHPWPELRVGRAGHAFDHVGGINAQAEAAAASGATIIYASGLGAYGYQGLPPAAELAAQRKAISQYNRAAKEKGIEHSLGYLCATSIVKLDAFDEHWSDELRAQFQTPPAEWRQQDRRGNPLASWYGGDYAPACMSHPDWRAYERFMVRQQLETGHDGIFFDNPTVHPQGCYCRHCMRGFAAFLHHEGVASPPAVSDDYMTVEALRQLADAHPQEFLRFRSTIGRDFLAHVRAYAHKIKPSALITCNNSLNTPDRLYAQCRTHGYNIHELSKAEDFVVVEDMRTQPRTDPGGQTFQYGPTYKQLHAISHGKPIVAVTLVNDDYHTPPNLMRLAMAEAAAHGASYLSWPTWPEDQRSRMIDAIRPQADFLREHEALLNDAAFRTDVVLFLPFRRWLETEQCAASSLAADLTQANIQYEVLSEDNFQRSQFRGGTLALLLESLSVLTPEEAAAVDAFKKEGGQVVTAEQPNWLAQLQKALERPSLKLKAPPTARAVVRDQPNRTLIHLLNLNVERLSSLDDQVTPAEDLALYVTVPFHEVAAVTAKTADAGGTSGPLEFTTEDDGAETRVHFVVPRVHINALVVIEARK